MIATSIALAALAASATAGGVVAAGAIQSHASGKAAKLATDSANRGADLQKQSNDDALKFQREESAYARQESERAARANYEQWAAQQRRYGSLDSLVGNPSREIPGYVPISQQGGDVSNGGYGAGVPGMNPDLDKARADFDKMFPGESLSPEMLKAKEKELAAIGFTLRPNAAGVVGKVQYQGGPIIDVIQGAGSGKNIKWFDVGKPAGAAAPYQSKAPQGSIASFNSYQPQNIAPRIEAPELYRPGSLGALSRRN